MGHRLPTPALERKIRLIILIMMPIIFVSVKKEIMD